MPRPADTATATMSAITMMVRSGNGAMPAFRPTEISDAELAALAQWISTSKKDPKEHGQ
jgi:mono/diheme cytochrome c family protein